MSDSPQTRLYIQVCLLSREIVYDTFRRCLRKFFVICPCFSPITAAVISHMCGNKVEIIYGCLQLNLLSKFPQNKPKLWKYKYN